MREVETDYLVVGAGASGMAFADTLVAHTDAEVVLVDRRHRPGGHWLDAYPFVRLHQPSAYYGVESRPLGNDRIDEHGPNAGFYERAGAPEICDYYSRVLDENLLPTGRVRFLGMSEYRGENGDGHFVVSLLDGSETVITPRRKVVDATYVQSEIPSRHVPGFTVQPGVTLVPPNDLVDLAEPADRFTVVGAGKTAIDTCVWLLGVGVDPTGSAGYGAAIRGSSTATSRSLSPWSVRTCGSRPSGSRRRRLPAMAMTSLDGSRTPGCSCGSTPQLSRWYFAARP